MDLEQKEKIEIDYWINSKHESPEKFTAGNFVNKTKECRNLNYRVRKNMKYFRNKKNILEIGAGQGWASCFIKRFLVPNANFTVTDISPSAVAGVHHWESIFEVKMVKTYPARSYQIEANDNSFDLIFCYAAAHHFVLYKETLSELKRLLTDNGHIVFLYEPTCSKLFYPLHYYYVNNTPHSTPEDVLIPSKMRQISEELGLNFELRNDAKQIILRGIATSIYFRILGALPFLQKVLPSSSDLIFSKRAD